mmetsp:Transcript_12326/g.37585  ORF Transcript_12326/g.37585 Transcript_12326/m.37585 type:complete len:98 (+) Transcript_12326:83-376(+)
MAFVVTSVSVLGSHKASDLRRAVAVRVDRKVVSRRTRAGVVMMAEGDGGKKDGEKEPEVKQTIYGLVVFAVTIVFFGLGLYATFARSFLPSGLAPPQ